VLKAKCLIATPLSGFYSNLKALCPEICLVNTSLGLHNLSIFYHFFQYLSNNISAITSTTSFSIVQYQRRHFTFKVIIYQSAKGRPHDNASSAAELGPGHAVALGNSEK
jgi:hypothetical protein